MVKLIFSAILCSCSVVFAGGNSGGTFSVKPDLKGKTIVFKTGQTFDSTTFSEANYESGKWVLIAKSIRDQELRNEDKLNEALVESFVSGDWIAVEE